MLDFEHPLRSHAPFLVRRVFEIHHGIKQRIRRRRSTILGVPSPILSSVEENNRKLKKEFLGGKNVNDPDPGIICSIETQCAAEKMSDEDFVKEIEQGKLYIGKLIEQQMEITISGSKKKLRLHTKTHARVRNPRKVLITLLLRAIEAGHLRLNQQETVIEVTDWWDETPVLQRGLLVWCLGLKFNEEIFKENVEFAEVIESEIFVN